MFTNFKFNYKYLIGYVIGVLATIIAAFILITPVSLDGIAVPDQLDDLVSASILDGYVPPVDIVATCVEVTEVSGQVKADIERVTQASPATCSVEADSWHSDALWGFIAALVVVGLCVAAVRLLKSKATLAAVAVVGLVIAAMLAGSIIDDRFKSWLDDNGVIMDIFWRGFIATLVLGVGAIIAHELARRDDPTVPNPAPAP